MKKRDSDKNPFEKKNLVKLAPAAVVIAAVAAAGAQAGSSGKEVTAETREVVKSQDLESLLKQPIPMRQQMTRQKRRVC